MAEFRILKVQKLVGGGGRVHFEKAKRASSRLLSSTSQPIIGRLAVTIASSEIALFQTPPLPTPPHSTSVPTLQTNPGIGFRALLLSLSPFLSLSLFHLPQGNGLHLHTTMHRSGVRTTSGSEGKTPESGKASEAQSMEAFVASLHSPGSLPH